MTRRPRRRTLRPRRPKLPRPPPVSPQRAVPRPPPRQPRPPPRPPSPPRSPSPPPPGWPPPPRPRRMAQRGDKPSSGCVNLNEILDVAPELPSPAVCEATTSGIQDPSNSPFSFKPSSIVMMSKAINVVDPTLDSTHFSKPSNCDPAESTSTRILETPICDMVNPDQKLYQDEEVDAGVKTQKFREDKLF